EDGIRDDLVTGVQTCALPIFPAATVAASAATSTTPIKPNTRSTSTTVVASVLDRAGFAVSRIRMTSPPILLGRKLLKKSATTNEIGRASCREREKKGEARDRR